MEANETQGVDQASGTQASGTSIFWALVALALNAVTESSRIGSLCFKLSRGPEAAAHSDTRFDPLRSSPIFCAAETILDILFFFVGPRPRESQSDIETAPETSDAIQLTPIAREREQDVLPDPVDVMATTPPPEPNTDITSSTRTTLKLLGFFLGVLPQAIKLFSMSGITGTQISAAMFLAASVTRAISYKSPSHFARSVDRLRGDDSRKLAEILLIGTFLVHDALYTWLYFNIAEGLFFEDAVARAERDRSGRTISFMLALFARGAYMMFGMLTILFGLVRRRSLTFVQWFPLFVLVVFQEGLFAAEIAAPGTWFGPLKPWVTNGARATALMTMSILGCLQFSAMCIAIGRVLSRLAAERAARSTAGSDGSDPIQPADADGRGGFTSRFRRVIVTIWQSMVWLKDVFVDLRNELNVDGKWLGAWHEEFGVTFEQIRLAWGIFNLLTALLYYLVVFDSIGTSSPSWTSALG